MELGGFRIREQRMAEEEASRRAAQDISSPKHILQFGRAARHRAETGSTWDHIRERLAQAYDLVLRGHGRR